MKLVWDGTDNEALPDFEYFNKFYDRLPRAKYVTIEDYVDLIRLHDLAGQEIINYDKKIRRLIAEEYENKGKSAEEKKPFKPIAGKRKKMFGAADVEEMKRLFASGKSKRKIAVIMHCSEKTVRNYLKGL